MKRGWSRALVMLSALSQMCVHAGPTESSPSLPQALLIQGYNYTDDYIDSFTVNGQGGGNLFVSGPLSGGGGSVCCVSYTPGPSLPVKLKVRWAAAYCMERIQNPYPYGEPYFDKRRSLWKEADALVDDAYQDKRRVLEVHIYKNGHVEASITQGDSPPRLKLPRTADYTRPGVASAYPACTVEQLFEMDKLGNEMRPLMSTETTVARSNQRGLLLAAACSVALSGCAQPSSSAQGQHSAPAVRRESEALLIQGYNYTDDYIDSFTVNGQGGGNLLVSGPLSGGGKSVCCVSYTPGSTLPIKLKVRWVGSYCKAYETSPYGRTSSYRKHLWREAEALADDVSQGKPRALEVHIYPDGHVEASITRGDSPPRLKLPRTSQFTRPGIVTNYPDCTDAQLRELQP